MSDKINFNDSSDDDSLSKYYTSDYLDGYEKCVEEFKEEMLNVVKPKVQELKKEKDAVYTERNILVAVLSKVFPSGIKKTAIEGWDEVWHNCVYIDIPNFGQFSWHYHNDEKHLFEHLPQYEGNWDRHTTEDKYERLIEFIKK